MEAIIAIRRTIIPLTMAAVMALTGGEHHGISRRLFPALSIIIIIIIITLHTIKLYVRETQHYTLDTMTRVLRAYTCIVGIRSAEHFSFYK